MASSQDIDYVPFTRQRKRPPSLPADTVFGQVEEPTIKQQDQVSSTNDDHGTTRRRPPAPPPPPVPFKDTAPLDRGRSTYRPNTLSKATIPPVPAILPPKIGHVSGAKRRSRSAPPPAVGFAGGATNLAVPEKVLRSRSGYGPDGGTALIGSALDPFIESGEPDIDDHDHDEGVDLGADDLEGGPSATRTWTMKSSRKTKPLKGESGFVLVETEASESYGVGVMEDDGVESHPVEVMRVPTAIGKTRKSRFGTPPPGYPVAGGRNGVERDERVTGSSSEEEDEMVARMNQAEHMLSLKQKKQIEKEEAKSNKTLSKIIKQEGKTEKRAINNAMSELEDLQRLHKQTVKLEAKALTSHSKTLSTYTKVLSGFEEVKKKYQGLESKVQLATIQLEQADSSLIEHKERARDVMDRMKEKREEVESLRKQYGIEERERVVHLGELNGELVVVEGEAMAKQKTVRGKSRFGAIIG